MKQETKRTILLIGILVIGLGLGNTISWVLTPNHKPPSPPTPYPRWNSPKLKGHKVQYGFITPFTASLEYYTPFVEEIIMADMNTYAGKLGYDVEFQFLIDNADGQYAGHLEKVQGFKSMDITLLIGGFWENQAQASLAYLNDNDMIMISPNSRTNYLSIPDNLYRTSPPIFAQSKVLGYLAEKIKLESSIIVHERKDLGHFVWSETGVVVYNDQVYSSLDLNVSVIQNIANIKESVGIHFDSVSLLEEFLEEVDKYPGLANHTWILSDHPVNLDDLDQKHHETISKLDIYIVSLSPVWSDPFFSIKDRYVEYTEREFDYYAAGTYDAAYMMMFGTLQTQSHRARNVKEILPDISDNFFGASGWTKFDENGDRKYCDYTIYRFDEAGEPILVGKLDGISDTFYWFENEKED
jgi:branched-chain amino acid transport system substrate-binding protein